MVPAASEEGSKLVQKAPRKAFALHLYESSMQSQNELQAAIRQFLGRAYYVCQTGNAPCRLLAIANVLLLRGQLALKRIVEAPGSVSTKNLMHFTHCRMLDPPLSNVSGVQQLTQEKISKGVVELGSWRLMKEGGADRVQVEGGKERAETILDHH
ncbi:hypothetical protein PRIC1_009744 [Phytophthora ramorum]